MAEAKAKLNYLRIAPRKVRSVADLIRRKPVEEALAQLKFSPKRSAKPLFKLLRSAIANAKSAAQLNEEDLYIKEIKVDQGPSYKRWMPRAFGRASPIRKKTSHVTIVLGAKKRTANKTQN